MRLKTKFGLVKWHNSPLCILVWRERETRIEREEEGRLDVERMARYRVNRYKSEDRTSTEPTSNDFFFFLSTYENS